MRKQLIGILIVWLFATVAHAEVYKWTDAQGNVHFGDRPPASQSVERVEIKLNTYESVSIEPFEAFKSNTRKRVGSVVMYSTTWCGVCKRAKRYLQEKRIPFQEYDVEKSDRGRRDFAKMNGRGVPIILVGDQRMNGFSEQRFESLYNGK